MPNHIKNRLEIIGTPEQIKEVFQRFNTFHERKPRLSYDGDLVYKTANGEIGWLDEGTNIFSRRGMEDVNGIPEGFEVKYEEEWNQFPDFEKVIPMPLNLSLTYDGFTSILDNQFSREEPLYKFLDREIERMGDVDSFNKGINNLCEAIKNYCSYGHATWYTWSIENWGTKWNSYSHKILNENTFVFETSWSSPIPIVAKMSEMFPLLTFKLTYADEDSGSNTGMITFTGGEQTECFQPESQSNAGYEIYFDLNPEDKDQYEFVGGKYMYKEDE